MKAVVASNIKEEESKREKTIIEGVEEDEVSATMQEETRMVRIQKKSGEVIGRREDTEGNPPGKGPPDRTGKPLSRTEKDHLYAHALPDIAKAHSPENPPHNHQKGMTPQLKKW